MAVEQVTSGGVRQEPVGTMRLDPRLIVSPTALSGNVNNYNPTGLNTALVLRIDPGGASRNITGLTATYHGHLLLVMNVADGAEDLVLKNQDTGSSAGNRFYGANNADVTIRRGGSCLLMYDGVDSRWKPVAI